MCIITWKCEWKDTKRHYHTLCQALSQLHAVVWTGVWQALAESRWHTVPHVTWLQPSRWQTANTAYISSSMEGFSPEKNTSPALFVASQLCLELGREDGSATWRSDTDDEQRSRWRRRRWKQKGRNASWRRIWLGLRSCLFHNQLLHMGNSVGKFRCAVFQWETCSQQGHFLFFGFMVGNLTAVD